MRAAQSLWLRGLAPLAIFCTGANALAAGSKPIETGRLPLVFFENAGQLAPDVQFAARSGGVAAFLGDASFSVRLARPAGDEPGVYRGVQLRYTFLGAASGAKLAAEDPTGGAVSFMKGAEAAAWRVGLPTFGAVRYAGLYPGVDAIVRDADGRLEYDLVLGPDAELDRVAIRCEGADRLELDEAGRLVAETEFGEVRQDAPTTWQNHADGTRSEVRSRFVLLSGDTFGFTLEGRDPSATIVIDPGITYASYLGGSLNEHGCGVSVDDDCALYIAGDTLSLDFPVTPGTFDTTHNGDVDSFVAKIVGIGNAMLWATYIGGTLGDFGHGVIVTAAGETYITGGTSSTDYPVTAGAYDTSHNGKNDVFVTRLNATGTALIYSTFIGGTGGEGSLGGQGIAVDASGAAYVTGFTDSPDFPTSFGAYDASPNGLSDSFVTKLAPDGSALVYSTYVGGSNLDVANAIDVDGAGNAYVGGFALSQDFPTTPGAFDTTANFNSNGFLYKLNRVGSSLVYGTYMGGSSEVVRGVAVDPLGQAYVTGYTLSTVFPATPGSFDPTPNNNGDAFVSKFDPTGSSLVYASYLGGGEVDVGNSIDTDNATGAAYLTGWTESFDFPTTASGYDPSYNGGPEDAFLVRVAADGSKLDYSTFLGGTGYDVGFAINVHAIGAVYFAGGTFSLDFPATAEAFDLTHNGAEDIFLALLPAGEKPCPNAASSATYGTGKAGVNGIPTLNALTAPQVPSLNVHLQLLNGAPNAPGFLFLGEAPAATPFDGGTLLVSPVFTVPLPATTGAGSLDLNLMVHENPNFCGSIVYMQAMLLDATVPNAYHTSQTNGLALTFGF